MNNLPDEELMQALLDTTKKQAEYINQLLTAVEKQTHSIDAIQQEIEKRPDKRSTLKSFFVFGAIMVFIIVGFFLRLNSIADTNRSTFLTIKDCVNPSGQCYTDGQTRTAEVVKTIICNQEKVVYMVVPAYSPKTDCISYIEKETGTKVNR